MKIYLSQATADRGGIGLIGNLQYLLRSIQNELNDSAFKSSFNELWLTIAYPPMYVLPGVVGSEVTFNQYYNSYPYSRMNRRFKKIDITLKAPEFSEYFDKEDQQAFNNKFEIEPQFKNITEAELGKILIDKFLEAGEIINSKLKKDDAFDLENYNKVLLSLRQQITPAFLQDLHLAQKDVVKDEILNRALQLRSERRNADKPKNKRILDLRVYYSGLPNKALYPYDYIYGHIFLNLLAKDGLMCPNYTHLYIQVATTFEEALKNSFSSDWHIHGLAVINYDKYKTLSDKEKENEVFRIILTGLKDIADIDKLDTQLIDKVANKIIEKGVDTELHFKTIENTKYKLVVTYFSRSMEEECPIYFNLTDKVKNITKRHQVGKAINLQLFLWFQKIILNNKKIKIKSSNSVLAQVWLYEKPTALEFDIEDLMK